jgi:hypothetical protein
MTSDTEVCEALSALRVLLPPSGFAALEVIEARLNAYDLLEAELAAKEARVAPSPDGVLCDTVSDYLSAIETHIGWSHHEQAAGADGLGAIRDAGAELKRLRRALEHIAETCIEDPDTAQFASRAVDGSTQSPVAGGLDDIARMLVGTLWLHPHYPLRYRCNDVGMTEPEEMALAELERRRDVEARLVHRIEAFRAGLSVIADQTVWNAAENARWLLEHDAALAGAEP